MSDLSLAVNGKRYSVWKRVRVTRSIESVSGSFSLEVSDRPDWPIEEGDECSVSIGKSKVITGYVDAVDRAFDKTSHTMTVEGRDATADLVDSSAYLDRWEFKNIPAQSLASRVCEPFGIPVVLQARLGQAEIPNIAKVSVDPGDTAFDVIDRACRAAGVLAISDGVGGLVLTRAGTARAKTALIQGQNILSGRSRFDTSGRFFQYFVLGQHRGSDDFFGSKAAHIKSFAEDENIRRKSRILLVRPEGNVTTAQAKTRAQWEASVRAARGDSVSVVVQGWTQGDGSLWPLNALVQIKAPKLRVEGQMLITEATHTKDEGGTVTELTLRRPDAYAPEPVVKKSARSAFRPLEGGV